MEGGVRFLVSSARYVTRCNRVYHRVYAILYTIIRVSFLCGGRARYICEVRINFERVSSLFYRLKCHIIVSSNL